MTDVDTSQQYWSRQRRGCAGRQQALLPLHDDDDDPYLGVDVAPSPPSPRRTGLLLTTTLALLVLSRFLLATAHARCALTSGGTAEGCTP